MENCNKKGIIILGGHVQGLAIARIYGEEKIPSIVIDKTKINISRHSKYCVDFYEADHLNLLSLLTGFIKTGKYREWLIMPTDDYYVKILSQNKSKLEPHFKISTDHWPTVVKCYNKRLTYNLAMSLNIDIPLTWMPDSEEELSNLNISYPCIIKPAVMHKFYEKIKKKVLLCRNQLELHKNYKKALSIIPNNEIIIQKVIQGSNQNQYSACFMFDGYKPLVSLAVRRKRQHPLDFGNATTFAETIDNSKIIELSVRLLKNIGYIGICEVEFKKDGEDGIYKFLEINPRSWKWLYLSKASKSPLLMSLYNYKHKLTPIFCDHWTDSSWKHLLTDIPVKIEMFLRKQLINDKNYKKKCYAVFSKTDIKPYFFELLYLPYFLMKR